MLRTRVLAHTLAARTAATLRLNECTNDWVVLQPGRADRPNQFTASTTTTTPPPPPPPPPPPHLPDCPFCAGNEHTTPPHVYSAPAHPDAAHAAEWALRVVPNKFPVVARDGDASDGGDPEPWELVPTDGHAPHHGCQVPGYGFHEVVVESPQHNSTLAVGGLAQAVDVMDAFRARAAAHADDPKLRFVTMFRNQGMKAGASLAHPHSQVVGLPIVPFSVLSRVETATRYFTAHAHCVFCRAIDKELADGSRIVFDSDHAVAFVPFAALSPFHLYVLPKLHAHLLPLASDAALAGMAEALATVTRALRSALGDPDFNLIVHQAPAHTPPWFLGEELLPHAYHTFAEIVPRLGPGMKAGFEYGSGCYSNANAPEHDAALLRAHLPTHLLSDHIRPPQ